jgi:hypothetical protein
VWSHGCSNQIYAGCCCILAMSVISSCLFLLIFQALLVWYLASVIFIRFVGAVLSKVAGAPIVPAYKLLVGDWFFQNVLAIICQTLMSFRLCRLPPAWGPDWRPCWVSSCPPRIPVGLCLAPLPCWQMHKQLY